MFSITNDLCDYFLANEQRVLALSKHSLAADEVVFQTLAMKSDFKDRLYCFEEHSANLYYIDWNRREGSSPCTFSDEDFEMLITLPDKYLFAKKFSESCYKHLVWNLYNTLKEE